MGLLFLFLGASATIGVSANKAWSDNFDTYALGQPLDGLGGNDGGWVGWADNPGAAGIISNNQSRSNPYSLEVRGPTDQVHWFNTTSGTWRFIAWQYIPVGQSGGTYGGTYFIMLNQYAYGGSDTKWSVQIHFDNINNCVESEFDTGPTLPLIYGQWVQLRVEINLTADWFQFFYNNQLLIEKAWTAGVNNDYLGDLAFDAVDLFADGSTSVYYDDLSFAPPGTTLTCEAGGPYTGETGQIIHFTGFADGGTIPYTWAWTFGDGGTSPDQNPDHAYTAAGTYNVTLTVTDATSNTATDYAVATITAAQPQLSIESITGGFGIKAVIKNTGTAAATNVAWKIQLTGGIILIGKTKTGTIATLAPGATTTVKDPLVFGFGKTTITVTADTAAKNATGKVFLFFVLGVA